MTVNRLTQISAEVVLSQANNRITQISAETVRSAGNLFNNIRLTQISAEVVSKLNVASIHQVALEVIQDINPINTETLKLCLPFDTTVGQSFTVDDSPSVHPMDLTSGGLPTIDATPSKFGGAALNVTTTDFVRVLLPQPDFNFIVNFTIEFWVYRNAATDGHVMGQWPSTTEKSWRILFNGANLEFEHTPDGSTVTTEIIVFTIPAATWTHVVFEEFDGIFTVYIDGIARHNVASFIPIYQSNVDLFIGKVEASTGGEEFDGSIDEFRIKVGEAVFQAPFSIPSGSVDCVTIIPDISWNPGNIGDQFECDASEFQIIVTGLETVSGLQTFTASNLPDGLAIDSNGNIFGTLPAHTSPPPTMEYFFQVTFFVGGIAVLGPATFSFDIKDRFADDILQVTVPTLLEDEDRTAWKIHLLNLIPNDAQFLPAGDDFGISLIPRLFIMDGLTEISIALFQTAVASFDPATRDRVIFKTLKFGTNGRFDVLYYSIEDRGSNILSFPNPLGLRVPDPIINPIPATIDPLSIDNIRDLLITGVGFDSQFAKELLPDWLTTYEPLVIAAFVKAGKGQEIVDKFDGDAIHHIFKGRTIVLDRLDVRRCSTNWAENGERRLVVKFDDIN